jgi:uncharacterized protein YbaR (Trm112 family)
MHVEVIERLRCPAEHAESALVAAAEVQIDRRIRRGVLGCPVCHAEYPIRDWVADFSDSAAEPSSSHASPAPDEEAVVRLAAQLELSEAQRPVLLCGSYAVYAPALSVMFDALCVAIGVAPGAVAHVAAHASVLQIARTVPLASGYLRGAAVDDRHAGSPGLGVIVELLVPAGRLVAPASRALPVGLRELARDDREVVAQRTTGVIPLRRARR